MKHKVERENLTILQDIIQNNKELRSLNSILNCSNFKFVDNNNNTIFKNSCHSRFCPMCSKAKNRRIFYSFREKIDLFLDKNKCHFLALTLTIRDFDIEKIEEKINLLNNSFKRLITKKNIKLIIEGYIKSIEIKYKEKSTNNTNAHIHCLLAIKPSAKTHNYIKINDLKTLWKEALRVSYTPSIDIDYIYRTKKTNANLQNKLFKIINYESKPFQTQTSDIKEKDYISWLSKLSILIKGKRLFTTSKSFKELIQVRPKKNPNSDLSELTRKIWDKNANEYIYDIKYNETEKHIFLQ